MALDDFARKILDDDKSLARDEDKLRSDDERLKSFENKMYGLEPDNRLAKNDADPEADSIRKSLGIADLPSSTTAVPDAPVQPPPDLSGVSTPWQFNPNTYLGSSGRLSQADIDRKFAGVPSNVDLSQMPKAPDDAALSSPQSPQSPQSPPSPAIPQSSAMQSVYAPGSHYVPAHKDPSLDWRSPGLRGNELRDLQNDQDINRGMTNSVAKGSDQVANILERANVDASIRARIEQDDEAARQHKIDESNQRWDATRERIEKGQYDPNSLYKNASTGTKIAFIIGSALSGASSNHEFLRSIDDSIKDDNDRQLKNIDKDKYLLESEMQHGRDLQSQNRDQRIYKNELEQLKWTDVQNQVKAAAQRNNSEQVLFQGDAINNEIQKQITALRKERERMISVPGQIVGSTPKKPETALIVKAPDGRQLLAPNEKTYNEMTDAIGRSTVIKSMLEKLQSNRKAEGSGLLLPSALREKQMVNRSIVAELTPRMNVFLDQGATSAEDKATIQDMLGNVNSPLWTSDAVLSSLSQRMDDNLGRILNAKGMEHTISAYGVNQAGHLVKATELAGESDKPRPPMPKGREVK